MKYLVFFVDRSSKNHQQAHGRLHHFGCKKSPRKSSRAIQAGLPKCTVVPSQRSILRRLFNANFKSFRPIKKPKLSARNIADCLAFCQQYQGWSAEQWRSVMFSGETLVTLCRHVRRPLKQRDDLRYIVPTVKNASKVMIWSAICAGGRSGLWFMPEGTCINGTVYLEVLKSKVTSFMEIKRCSQFQQDGALFNQTKVVKK